MEAGVVFAANELGAGGAVEMDDGRVLPFHFVRTVEAHGHEFGGVVRRLRVDAVQGGVLPQNGRREGHEIAAFQQVVQPVDHRPVRGAHQDGPVAEGAGPPLHAPGKAGDDIPLCEQGRRLRFDIFDTAVLEPGVAQDWLDFRIRVGFPPEHIADPLRGDAVVGAQRSQAESPVPHVRQDKEALNFGQFVEALVQFYVGHHASGHGEMAQSGLLQVGPRDFHDILFQVLLRPGGQVFPAKLVCQRVFCPVNTALAKPESARKFQMPVLIAEREGHGHVFGDAARGQSGNLAFIPAGHEPESLGQHLEEQAQAVPRRDRPEPFHGPPGHALQHQQRQAVAHAVNRQDQRLFKPGEFPGGGGMTHVVLHVADGFALQDAGQHHARHQRQKGHR